MGFEIFLYSYGITTGIALFTWNKRFYSRDKKRFGKRYAIMESIKVSLLCFIPYVVFGFILCSAVSAFHERIENWIERDPTAPRNINNPDFVPPPKKEKKFEPIKSRAEILDLETR